MFNCLVIRLFNINNEANGEDWLLLMYCCIDVIGLIPEF